MKLVVVQKEIAMPDEQKLAFVEGDEVRIRGDKPMIAKEIHGKKGLILKWYAQDLYEVLVVTEKTYLLRASEMERLNG